MTLVFAKVSIIYQYSYYQQKWSVNNRQDHLTTRIIQQYNYSIRVAKNVFIGFLPLPHCRWAGQSRIGRYSTLKWTDWWGLCNDNLLRKICRVDLHGKLVTNDKRHTLFSPTSPLRLIGFELQFRPLCIYASKRTTMTEEPKLYVDNYVVVRCAKVSRNVAAWLKTLGSSFGAWSMHLFKSVVIQV